MPATNTSLLMPFGKVEAYTNPDIDENVVANAIYGPLWLKGIHIVNGAALTYLKLFNLITETPGASGPSMIIMCTTSLDAVRMYAFEDDLGIAYPGIPFHLGLSMHAVTTPGTGGTTAPTAALAASFFYQRMTAVEIADLVTKGIV